MRRNGFSREQVLAIIAHQATREARLAAADDVVVNDEHATLDSLRQQVDALHARYLALAGDDATRIRKVHDEIAIEELPRTATKMRCGQA